MMNLMKIHPSHITLKAKSKKGHNLHKNEATLWVLTLVTQ